MMTSPSAKNPAAESTLTIVENECGLVKKFAGAIKNLHRDAEVVLQSSGNEHRIKVVYSAETRASVSNTLASATKLFRNVQRHDG